MTVETIEYAGSGSVTLVADVRGDPDANPILFMHGGGQTRHSWGGAAELLAERGYGNNCTFPVSNNGHHRNLVDGPQDCEDAVQDHRAQLRHGLLAPWGRHEFFKPSAGT